jgi:hypothetical protein
MRRSIHTALLLLLVGPGIASAQPAQGPAPLHTLMPVPKSVAFQAGRLPVQAGFTAAIGKFSDPRLLAGLDRTLRRIERRTGLE